MFGAMILQYIRNTDKLPNFRTATKMDLEASICFINIKRMLCEIFMRFDPYWLTVKKIVTSRDTKKHLKHF
jgi:hypothetical protein